MAESDDKGGTWQGVIDGLKKGRKIFVRKPDEGENNANNLLIEKGAAAVDLDGNVPDISSGLKKSADSGEQISLFEK